MAYFNSLKDEKPDNFIDQKIPLNEYDRLEMSEREVYEATCREGRPYVSVWVLCVCGGPPVVTHVPQNGCMCVECVCVCVCEHNTSR